MLSNAYKGKVIAKGYMWSKDNNYEKTTFASIAWLDNIKTILIVTSHQKIILFQFDV